MTAKIVAPVFAVVETPAAVVLVVERPAVAGVVDGPASAGVLLVLPEALIVVDPGASVVPTFDGDEHPAASSAANSRSRAARRRAAGRGCGGNRDADSGAPGPRLGVPEPTLAAFLGLLSLVLPS